MPSWSSASASADAVTAGMLRRFVEASRRAEIVALVNEAQGVEEVAQVAASELAEAFEAEVAFVLACDGAVLGRVGVRPEQAQRLAEDALVAAALTAERAQIAQGEDLLGLGLRRLALAPAPGGDGRTVLVGVGRLYDEGFPPSEVALLESVVGSVGHALERGWLGEERDRQVARSSALARAAKALNASLVRDEVLQTLCAEVGEALEADLVAVFFTEEVRGLEVVAGRGLPPGALGGRSGDENALCLQALRRAAAVVVAPSEEEVVTGVEGTAPVRAALAVPTRRREEVDGVLLVGFYAPRPVHDADVQFLAAFADLAGVAWRNADDHAAVRRAATLDPLTGCLNHGAFQGRLREELARADRTGRPAALALLDLDDFKAVNDRFGHLTGDALLRTVAEVLRGAVRPYDIVGRLGGDEFALLLPATDEETAQHVLDRAQAALGRAPLPGGSSASASAGLTPWRPGDRPDDLLDRADRALFAAKAQRRGSPRLGDGDAPDHAGGNGVEHEQLQRLATAGALGTRLARLLDPRGIAETAVAELGAELGYERCLLVRRDEGGGLAVLAAAHPAGAGADLQAAATLEGALPRSVAEERTVLVADALADPAWAGLTPPGVRAELAVPVYAGPDLWGAIALRSSEPGAFDETDAHLVRTVADHVGAAMRTAELYHALDQTSLATAAALAAALEERDLPRADEGRALAELAVRVGRRLGMGEAELRDLRYAAIFHDIGKIAIPDAILFKPAALNEDEKAVVRRHPEAGERILASVPFLSAVRAIVRHDHEHWDGTGYPDGLQGEEIPLGARIVLAVDAWQAMTSDRPWRLALDDENARAELVAGAGTQFDPAVVDALIAVLAADEEPAGMS